MPLIVLLRLEDGRIAETATVAERDAARRLFRLANSDDGHVAWYDRRLEPYLKDPASWPGLLRHGLEVLHLGALQRTDRAAAALGRVDFDSPFLLPGPADRRFATWLISPMAGIAPAALLRAVGFDPRCGGLAACLLDFGRRGMGHGMFPYSDPALLAHPVPPEVLAEIPCRIGGGEIATLIARGYGRRWLSFAALGRGLFSLPAGLRAPMPPVAHGPALARMHPAPDPAAVAGETVDAIIPTLGRPGPLRDLLADLAAQSVPPRRVLVVDQRPPGAELPAADFGSDWPFELRVQTVDWLGACRARNLALASLRSDWAFFLDDDVRLQPTLVADLLALARAYHVGAVNASVYLPHQNAEPEPGAQPKVWATFGAGATLVSAAAVREAGPFDERLEGGYGEDAEYGLRLRQAGCNVIYAPAARVLHLKAPAGGFRHPLNLPWQGEAVQPRPSPIFLYARAKHVTPAMREGYRLFYILGRLRSVPPAARPAELLRVKREWRRAAHWAAVLAALETGA